MSSTVFPYLYHQQNFADSGSHGLVFSFSRGTCNNGLLLGAPRNRRSTQPNEVGGGRTTGGGTTTPIYITVTIKRK
ncbi:unnamed protein product [Linum trigynum]|uniref:Uncharacterized protein n=1 Tax=Linum trigynum TaxID=586398 RepID=A0AAV2FPY6_9ROSI